MVTAAVVAATLCTSRSQALGQQLVLPVGHVRAEDATFYVFRDDVVIFPISFSIPKERILSRLPEKSVFALNDSQRSFTFKNYQFGPLQEEEYHANIQRHRFGDTRKKGGFDCLRHYELLANGCVPVVLGIEHMPKSVLTSLPRSLLWRARELFDEPWAKTQEGPGEHPAGHPGPYEELAGELLRYTAEHLSTESAARYILNTMNIPEKGSKVLFLPCVAFDNFPSYLTSSVFHGLVSILGDNVIDVPEYQYAYQFADSSEEGFVRGNLWGQGFTLGFRLPRRPHLDRSNISQRIRAYEFDFVIFARMSPYEPCNFWYMFGAAGNAAPEFFEDVYGRFPLERVALLYGDDSGLDDAVVRTHMSRMGALHRGIGYVFMRELLPFVSEGPPSEVLRPVDDRLLQPGCFQREWLLFFELWHGSKGLRACVAWGDCGAPVVSEYLDSWHFDWQRPAFDPPALKQFCRTGFALKAAVLAQVYGPSGCLGAGVCRVPCDVVIGTYARSIMASPVDLFFGEFGVTPAQVLYSLSHGCSGGALALQPSSAQRRQGVVIVADPGLPWRNAGPLAGVRQLSFLLKMGFHVLLIGMAANISHLASQVDPSEPLEFLAAPRLHLLATGPEPVIGGGGLTQGTCDWYLSPDGGAFPFYVHVELPPPLRGSGAGGVNVLEAVLRCLVEFGGAGAASGNEERSVTFVSVQMWAEASPSAWANAVAALARAGYRRFKVSLLLARHRPPTSGAAATGAVGDAPAGTGLGGPVGDLAVDASVGPRWRPVAEVLADAPAGYGQLHAAI